MINISNTWVDKNGMHVLNYEYIIAEIRVDENSSTNFDCRMKLFELIDHVPTLTLKIWHCKTSQIKEIEGEIYAWNVQI